jgi:hypothetical protein
MYYNHAGNLVEKGIEYPAIECCALCNSSIENRKGYTNAAGVKTCYECIAKMDMEFLLNLPVGKRTSIMYWNDREITNWPGTLKITPTFKKISVTNWKLVRTDMWFKLDGKSYYAKHIGHNTQICHVQRIAS